MYESAYFPIAPPTEYVVTFVDQSDKEINHTSVPQYVKSSISLYV
jgi:hypothetical protein